MSSLFYHKLRERMLQIWNPKERRDFLSSLSIKELEVIYQHPELFLSDKQIPPETNWRYHLFMGGRGSGKSFAETGWLYQKYLQGAKSLGLCGATHGDIINDILPQFLSWFPPKIQPKYNSQKGLVPLPNGGNLYVYSSETEVRGPNLEYLACDEMCKWCDGIDEKQLERYSVLEMAVRIGNNPQIFIASTPKDLTFFRDFVKQVQNNNPLYHLVTSTMDENLFISQQFRTAMINKYGGTRLGRQEIYGELLEKIEGALFSTEMIDKTRITPELFDNLLETNKLQILRTVIAIDPAVTSNKNSDETGIVVLHLCSDNKVYVAKDCSGRHTPAAWAKLSIQAYNLFEANLIVAEVNNGGDLVEMNIQALDRRAPIKKIHASKGKITRAEPVCGLYERGKVCHIGNFKELEYQMTHFTGDPKDKSPDRMDALCYGVTELLLSKVYSNRDLNNLPSY